MNWLFASGGQRTGVSASASVFPMNIQCRFPLVLTGLISLQSKGFLRVFSSTTVQKHQFFGTQPSLFIVQLSYPYMTTGKTIALAKWIFVIKMISLLFNMLYRCFIAFYFLTLWLWSPSTMVLKPKKIKSVTVFTNMGTTQKIIFLYIYIYVYMYI